MKVLGVIPARYGSTRFPGKPLALINGKPLLQWVIEGCRESRSIDRLLVATDDERIAALARSVGVEAAMTASDLPTGSDRVWQAAKDSDADVVLNIQGDEPLIKGWVLDALVEPFASDAQLEMATLGRPLTHDDLGSANIVKIVLNRKDEALYFSRFPIPYSRVDGQKEASLTASMKHIGIYAYRRRFLQAYCAQPPVALETCESLEQLRALYMGARIRVVRVEHDSWGVDTPEDVQKIEKIMRS